MELSLQKLLTAVRHQEPIPIDDVIHYGTFNLGMKVISQDLEKTSVKLADEEKGYDVIFIGNRNYRYWTIITYQLTNPNDDACYICSNSYHNVGRRLRSLSHGRSIIQGHSPA